MNNTALRWLWTVSGRKKLNILALTLVQALHGASGVLYALLLREIVKANWQVLRLIWSPRLEVEPELHTFHTKVKSDFGKAILANSITLTPGTITVHVRDDLFMVHCLDRELAEVLEDSEFEKRLEKMEAKKS